MSYTNPMVDSHGNELQYGRQYRAYCADKQHYLVELAEDDGCGVDCIKIHGQWVRYDEVQVVKLVPVDECGMDLNEPTEQLNNIALLQADINKITKLQQQIEQVVDNAARRLGLADAHGFAFTDHEEDFRIWMCSGDVAYKVMEKVDGVISPVSRSLISDSSAA